MSLETPLNSLQPRHNPVKAKPYHSPVMISFAAMALLVKLVLKSSLNI